MNIRMSRIVACCSRLPVALAVIGTLLYAAPARAQLTYVPGQPSIFEMNGFVCNAELPVCPTFHQGTIAPPDLSPFTDAAFDGIRLTGLVGPTALTYTANSADNGSTLVVVWTSLRFFDVSGPPGQMFSNHSHLDGSVSYDSGKFTVIDLWVRTSFQDRSDGPALLQIVPAFGGVFSQDITGTPVTLPLGGGGTVMLFAMRFKQGLNVQDGETITLSLPSSLISQTVAVVPVVPFAAFAARLEVERRQSTFELESSFSLGPSSNGIDPLTEDVTLHIGTFTVTIPAGSFRAGKDDGDGDRDDRNRHDDHDKKGKKPERFAFEGAIDGVWLEVQIHRKANDVFELNAEGRGANVGTANPVTIGLTIGDDSGSTSVIVKR